MIFHKYLSKSALFIITNNLLLGAFGFRHIVKPFSIGFHFPILNSKRPSTVKMMSSSDISSLDTGNEINDFQTTKGDNSNSKKWNLKGLKDEVSRQYLRTFKKVGKANERFLREQCKFQEIVAIDRPTLEQLESCPNPETAEQELITLQKRLEDLKSLEDDLKGIRSTSDINFEAIAEIAEALNISDTKPAVAPRGPKKAKSPPSNGPRLPYNEFISQDGIEIRVGRRAEDNDELSCNPEHRDSSDWWMHVAGCPGSHVVIRCHDNDLPAKFKQTVSEAAILAAVNSKANKSGKVGVSLTRCRDVTKPRGAKPGLVQLRGSIATVTIDMNVAARKLESIKKLER